MRAYPPAASLRAGAPRPARDGRPPRIAWRVAALALLLALGACASLPPRPNLGPTRALADPVATRAGQLVARQAPVPGRSGVRLLAAGDDALAARLALADAAERTLDLQYYLIDDDASSNTVLDHVQQAAERGVRVRVLVDDLNTAGSDPVLQRLANRPNIELRLYNPFPSGRGSTLTRVLSSLTDFARINRRMHNKLFVADNALAVTGGRNLGDAYFVHSEVANFVDLDLLIGGPAVRQLSRSFDGFWNSPLAYPAALFLAPAAAAAPASGPVDVAKPEPRAEARSDTRPGAPASAAPPAAAASTVDPQSALPQELASGRMALTWAPMRVLADRPSKTENDGEPAPDETLADDLEGLLRSAQREAILISPYFVPGPRGMALFAELRRRGVAVRVLTNSLASSDAPLVHIGYSRYREALLRLGVTIDELQPSGRRDHIGLGSSFGTRQSRLHAKAVIVDRRLSLVGSMNLDPRSRTLNTELGVLVGSDALGAELGALFDRLEAEACYRVELDESGQLRWRPPGASGAAVAAEPDSADPGTDLWLRVALKLLAPFAPDEML